MSRIKQISASLFASDILYLGNNISALNNTDIDSFHIDIMDGHFVPLYGFNNIWIREIKTAAEKPIDIHLMTEITKNQFYSVISLMPSLISIHLEAMNERKTAEYMEEIRKHGIKAGIAIKPCTVVSAIAPYMSMRDDVLVLSTEPGTENSIFLKESFGRIANLRRLINSACENVTISVDGALSRSYAGKCFEYGADRCVMGRSLFASSDIPSLLYDLKNGIPI